MTKRDCTTLARKIKRLEGKKSEVEKEITTLKAQLKAEMETRGVDELETSEHVIRWKAITKDCFDATAFKSTHAELYKQYCRQKQERRFTIA